MRAVIPSGVLNALLATVRKASNPKGINPTLRNVKLTFNRGSVHALCTDGEQWLERAASVEGLEGGWSCAVDVQQLADIASKAPAGEITLAIEARDRNRLAVRAGRASYALPLADAEIFPVMPAGGTPMFTCKSGALKGAIKRVKGSGTKRDSKMEINWSHGLMVYLHGGTIRLFTCLQDSAMSVAGVDAQGAPDGTLVLPLEFASTLEGMLPADDDMNCQLYKNGGALLVEAWATTGVFPLFDLKPPPAEKVQAMLNIQATAARVNVKKDALVAALQRLTPLYNPELPKAVRLVLPEGGPLELETERAERGEGRDVIEPEYSRWEFNVSLRVDLLMSLLGNLEGETVDLINSAPGRWMVVDPRDPNTVHMMMEVAG